MAAIFGEHGYSAHAESLGKLLQLNPVSIS